MVNIIDIILFIVVAVVVLVVASLNKNRGERSHSSNETIIDVTPIYIKDDSVLIKSESLKENITTITEGSTSTKNDTVFQNVINFLNSDEVFFRYGKNKVEKDYQQDLEHKLALLKERFDHNIRYEAKEGKHRVDFVIEDTVGIEMKVHKGGTQVEKELFYQIPKYGKLYPKIIGLVLNDSDVENQQLKNEIETRLRDQNVLDRKDYEIIVKTIGYPPLSN
jgi:hypothetical protein